MSLYNNYPIQLQQIISCLVIILLVYYRSSQSVRMPLFHRLQQILFLVILLAAVCSAKRIRHSKRPLLRASAHERVPDSYFVHLRKSVKMEQVHELVRYLHLRSSEGGNFSAHVASIITRAGYGFSARLSQEALQHVSFDTVVSQFSCCMHSNPHSYFTYTALSCMVVA